MVNGKKKEPRLFKERNENDVILARGFAAREYSGTKHFHELIRRHADDYHATTSWDQKNLISAKIVASVRALVPTGRFIKPDKSSKSERWIEIPNEVVLRKTKQALRDCARRSDFQSLSTGSAVMPHPAVLSGLRGAPPFQQMPPPGQAVLAHANLPRNQTGFMHSLGQTGLFRGLFNVANRWAPAVLAPAPNTVRTTEGQQKRPRSNGTEGASILLSSLQTTTVHGSALDGAATLETPNEEEDAAKQLLTLLTGGEAETFTAEDERRERAQLTEDEKQAALADVFGDMRQPRHAHKRAKRSDPGSIESLLVEMRQQVDAMPVNQKSALLEAMSKALPHEFHNDRLELFLRCESMDTRKAALRFVLYWEERRKLFEADKFCLPMTLEGAFRDDHAALEAGTAQLLPGLDASGRQLMWYSMANHTKAGYTSRSALRAHWYMYEAASEHPNAGRGIVNLHENKGASLWDFDLELDSGTTRMVLNVIPMRLCAAHGFNLPFLVQRVLMPIWLAIVDRYLRSRLVVHDVPSSQLVERLRDYGIMEDVIPTDIGGKYEHSHSAWLAKRRAMGK